MILKEHKKAGTPRDREDGKGDNSKHRALRGFWRERVCTEAGQTLVCSAVRTDLTLLVICRKRPFSAPEWPSASLVTLG